MAGTEHAGQKFCHLAGPAAAYVRRPRIDGSDLPILPTFVLLYRPLQTAVIGGGRVIDLHNRTVYIQVIRRKHCFRGHKCETGSCNGDREKLCPACGRWRPVFCKPRITAPRSMEKQSTGV
ncbi:unnamed protein product [Sphagnum troendelagicum]